MTSKLVVNTIEADTGISSVSFASSISMNSTAKFHFSAAGIDIGADTNINRPASGVLGFNINSSEKVRINSDGKVGIGTDNPNNPLTVHGSGNHIFLKDTATNNIFQIRHASGIAEFNTYGTGGAKRDYVFNQYTTEALRIDSSGRLLIGTTTEGNSSADNLTVADSGESGITVRSGTSNGGHIYFSDATSGTAEYQGFVSYQHNGDFMKFGTTATERLRITSTGLGIGGVTPTRELTLYSPDSGSTYINLTNSTTGTTTGDGFGIGLGGDEVARIWNYENTGMEFATNSIERLRITSAGTVNIGGSTQTTHLLYLQSTGDASIHLAADTDNVTEDHNPSISMSQDGGGATQMFKIGMEAGDGAEFSQSIGNGCYIHANNSSSQPLQLAHMDNLAVTISSVHGSHFHTYGGNTVAGVKIANRGNDTAAALLLQGHNNSGGTPGQATNFQITHKGANATTNFRHLGTDRLVIGSTGVVSGDLNDTSDIALKKDIESISTSCIDNIKQLNPVTFKWKDTSRKDIGFIAQEVEVILPDLVNGEDGVKSINTIGLVSQLTKALQEAITEIESLKTKVAALKGS